MKLDIGEQIRERPAFEDAIKEQPQNIKPEMEKTPISLETDKKSEDGPPTQQWNIPASGGEEEDLEALMSQMSLAAAVAHMQDGQVTSPPPTTTTPPPTRVRALTRLVRLALSRADRRELKELGDTATLKSRPEFVRHLGRLLDKDGERAKDDKSDGEVSKRTTSASEGGKVQTREEERRDKPKRKDLIEGLKDENDLCPRSPMRPQHHRPNNFPYQNTSRNHHSGGIMSAVAYSDAIGPTPQYHNHSLYQSLGAPASRPPLIAESSDVLPTVEMTFNDLDSMGNLSEWDLQILMSLAMDLCPKITTDNDTFPKSISEINSTQMDVDLKGIDHRVPTTGSSNILEELFPSSSATVEAWRGTGDGGYYHDDSTSGCSSLSPNSFSPRANPESPDSGRVVPDNTAPNMSPSGQFFDDRLPTAAADYVFAKKGGGGFHDDRSPAESSGYSSTGIPSPSEYPTPDEHAREDFDTKVQNASNDYFCNFELDFDSEYLLPKFEDVFESPAAGFYAPANATATSEPVSPFNANIDVSSGNLSANISASQNIPCPIAEFEKSSELASEGRTTFTTLTNAPVAFAPGYAVSPPTYHGTVDASHIRPALQAKQVVVSSPPVSHLKRLKPKVQHLLRVQTGRERILKLMKKKKKAEAWVNISLRINEVAKQDQDGDNQMMILCANAEGNNEESYVLEYVYAMVEMLKRIPGTLSAVNHQQHSAVYLAALHGDYPHRAIVVRYIAETLIELGEELVHTTESGDSLLHELCKEGDQRYDVLVELLSLKNQAGQPYFDVNQYNINGLTPLHVAVQSHGVNNVTSLNTVQLLMAERANILLPEKTESHTALHLAIVKSCAPGLVERLLRGADQAAEQVCNALNLRRDSPLHSAASRNDLLVAQQAKVIQLLLQHGAVKSLNVGGKYPIALVAEERRQEIRRVYETRKGNHTNLGMM